MGPCCSQHVLLKAGQKLSFLFSGQVDCINAKENLPILQLNEKALDSWGHLITSLPMKTHFIILCAVVRRTNNGITMSWYLCILLLCVAASQACALTADRAKVTTGSERTPGCAAPPNGAGRAVCLTHSQGIFHLFKQTSHSALFTITYWKMKSLFNWMYSHSMTNTH